MKTDDLYNAWLEHKKNVDISGDFTEQIMNKITQYQQAQSATALNAFNNFERLIAHPLARAALIAAGLLIGLSRIIFTVHVAMG